jgi:hypothetical protein
MSAPTETSSIDAHELAVRLAAALLLQDGLLSISEIEAIPGVRNRSDASSIAQRLLRMFDAELVQQRIPGHVTSWDPALKLRSPLVKKAASLPPRHTVG